MMPILIIVFIWLMASLIVYWVTHWQQFLAILLFGSVLFLAWWLGKPVVFEQFYLALVRLSVRMGRLKQRGLGRMAVTGSRATPRGGRHVKGASRAPGP